jgi:transketolase
VLAEADGDHADAIVIASGSEVSVALAARAHLATAGVRVRVVSMPCWELFAAQDPAYRESVLPAAITARVAVEAGVTLGWREWVGTAGAVVGIDRYGASAPGEVVLEKLGITPEAVEAAVRQVFRAED